MGADLLNVKTGLPETVGDEELAPLLAAGTHRPAGGEMAIVTPDGDLATISTDKLSGALRSGYTIPTQEQLNHFGTLATYGGKKGAGQAALAGAARGATLGLSDVLATGKFMSPEAMAEYREAHPTTAIGPGGEAEQTLKGLKEANPGISTASEIGGAVASALAMPGSSLPGFIGKGGEAIAGAVLPEGAGAAAQIGARALGGAAEGAAYGAGSAITEAALGNPNLTGEKILAHIGLGALFGGALGGIVKAGAIGIPKSLGAARESIESGWQKLFGERAPIKEKAPFFTPESPAAGAPEGSVVPPSAPEAAPPADALSNAEPGIISKMIAKATGAPEAEVAEAFAGRGAATGKILSKEEYAQAARDIKSTLQSAHDAMESAGGHAGGTVRPQESAELLAGADPALAAKEIDSVRHQFGAIIDEMKGEPSLYPARFPAKLQLIADDLAKVPFDATAAETYAAIGQARKALDTRIPWGKEISGEAADAVALAKELRGGLRASLENEKVWGEAAARTAAFNESSSARFSALKELRTQFMRKVPTRSGGIRWEVNPRKVSEFLNQINDPRGEMRANALKEFFQTSLDHIDQIEKTYANAPFETFDRKALQGLIEKNIGQATEAQNAVQAQPDMGFGGLGNLVKATIAGSFGGPLGALLAVGKGAAKMAMGGTPSGGATGAGMSAIPAQVANVERAALKVSNVVQGMASGIVRGIESSALRVGASKVAAEFSGGLIGGTKKRIEEVRNLTKDPNKLVSMLHDATEGGQAAIPKTIAGLQTAAARGLSFLASKIPTKEPEGPFSRAPELTAQEAIVFNRYFEAVHHPLEAMREFGKDGRISPQAMEALHAVYPGLIREAQQSIFEELAGHKDRTSIPYQARIAISEFMGQALDPSLNPMAIQRAQTIGQISMAQNQAKNAPHPRPTQGGLGKIDIANRSQTMFQQTAARES